jgi:hypothetical protein
MGLASMHACVLLEFIKRLCVEIDGFNVCVLLEIVEIVYAEIDGFNVCVFCCNLVTIDMMGLLQHVRCVFMPKCELSAAN